MNYEEPTSPSQLFEKEFLDILCETLDVIRENDWKSRDYWLLEMRTNFCRIFNKKYNANFAPDDMYFVMKENPIRLEAKIDSYIED